ncbi:MAG: thiolase family protein [Vampirovibrionales bacterium]|nr:thiolase family protein [Vampirovibrionales bacterium]
MSDVFIVAAKRTALGAFNGVFSGLTAATLGATAISAAVEKANVPKDAIAEVLMGCVLPAGQGQAPARQALRAAGLLDSTGAVTLNKVCGSGLKAVMMAKNAIASGDSDVIVAGGMECMSQVPYYLPKARQGYRMGHQQVVDGMIHDGLWDPYGNFHMGTAGEQCATHFSFTREAQDVFATESYTRARHASDNGLFDAEIAPVLVPQRKGEPTPIAKDEQPFADDIAKLATLRPAFDKTGTITAGNASTINDGAAALVVASEQAVTEHGLKPLAKIVGQATFSQAPEWFTTAPVGAIEAVLKKTGLTISNIDVFEINEAFAVVTMAAMQELNIPHTKVNIRGGAIALGHPIGASGARLLVTLIHTLQPGQKGLATLCIGGGEAVAMVIERL